MEKYYIIVKPADKIVLDTEIPFKRSRESTYKYKQFTTGVYDVWGHDKRRTKPKTEDQLFRETWFYDCYERWGDSHVRMYKYPNEKAFYKDYKKSGRTTLLNRDRFNDIVGQIERALYAKFDEWKDDKILLPYDPNEFKIKNQYTRSILKQTNTPILIVNEKGIMVYGIDVKYFSEEYPKQGQWWKQNDLTKAVESIATVVIDQDGSLSFGLEICSIFGFDKIKKYIEHIETHTDDYMSYDKWLGDLRKILV